MLNRRGTAFRRSSNNNFNLIIIGFVALLVAVFGLNFYMAYGTQEVVTATIKKTERVCESTTEGSSCKYLVFTDKEVLENTDSLLRFKFNSSDIHSDLTIGKQYKFTVIGFRVGFFSMYRNIIEVNSM